MWFSLVDRTLYNSCKNQGNVIVPPGVEPGSIGYKPTALTVVLRDIASQEHNSPIWIRTRKNRLTAGRDTFSPQGIKFHQIGATQFERATFCSQSRPSASDLHPAIVIQKQSPILIAQIGLREQCVMTLPTIEKFVCFQFSSVFFFFTLNDKTT